MAKKGNKKLIGLGIVATIIILGAAIIFAKPSPQNSLETNPLPEATQSFSSEEAGYNFGAISMADGKVSHVFKIKNESDQTISATKLYTSCMCTTATLKIDSRQKGPFGMPGHGFLPKFNETLEPGQEGEIEVVFDPTAHGPAGIGKITRTVYLENTATKKPFELYISATVTP